MWKWKWIFTIFIWLFINVIYLFSPCLHSFIHSIQFIYRNQVISYAKCSFSLFLFYFHLLHILAASNNHVCMKMIWMFILNFSFSFFFFFILLIKSFPSLSYCHFYLYFCLAEFSFLLSLSPSLSLSQCNNHIHWQDTNFFLW